MEDSELQYVTYVRRHFTYNKNTTCLTGAYIVNRNDVSKPANAMNANEEADVFWKPEVNSSYSRKVQY